MVRAFISVGLCLWAAAANADTVGTKSALDDLFSADRIAIQVAGHLSDGEKATIRALVPLMAEQMRTPARYYGAIAYAQDDGLASESLQGAFNFHSVASADAAALAACRSAAVASGTCRLAARILPREYKKDRTLTLSQGATAAVRGEFRRAARPRFFARSVVTGAWGVGSSAAEAIAACNAETSSRNDCQAVIAD